MEASIAMLRRIQYFCAQHNAEYLTMAHALGSCWSPGLLELAGFKFCDCERVEMQGLHFCMDFPTPPRHQGTGISRPASQEATDTAGMIAQGLIDDIVKKATASRTTPVTSQPAAQIANKKEYCSHWLHRGECAYTQTGCRYKHEMPADQETLEKCGIREIPRWFMESPHYEEYLQKTGKLAIGRLAGVSAEENVTSTAGPSRQILGQRGETMVGAGRTLMTPTTSRDARQLVLPHVRSPYENHHQSIVTPQPDAKSTRAGPPSAAEGSSQVKDADVEKPPRRQAKNNGGISLAAGSPHFRQFQQALGGSHPSRLLRGDRDRE
ncbi:hypothetical protein BDR22DRAFT_857387 [Usnea florida]